MSDFTQTMNDWRRMCKKYTREEDEFDMCCKGCPLDDLAQGNCGAIYDEYFADAVDWEELEKRIDAWAAEHPEPQYPTWGEWFEAQGELMAEWRDIRVVSNVGTGVIGVLYQPIPAEIAEKLGIEPKEG